MKLKSNYTIQLSTCLVTLLLLIPLSANAQRKMESLGRSVTPVRKSSASVFVSWRIPGTEFDNGTTYNLYRNSELIASGLSVSNFTDNTSLNGNYQVAPVINGVEQPLSPAATVYPGQVIEVPIDEIGDYYVHFAWVGDLDGDGEFEFVVDRIPNLTGVTTKVEAYKMDGTKLWQIDMGPLSLDRNGIEGGAAALSNGMWDGITVYDLDSDGKAEVILKTADGTRFADGTEVEYPGDIQNFISIIDGVAGTEKARIALPDDYLSSGPLQAQLNIAYLDGIRPSVVVKAKNRRSDLGFNLVMVAYDYNGTLTQRWKWLRPQYNDYPDFHQQRIADMDMDGKDEISDGGYVIDDDGTPLYSLADHGAVHGDRFQIGDLDPDRRGLEGYAIQQDNATGLAWIYYDAKDGTPIQTQYRSQIGDYARGNAADLDPRYPGFEMWTFTDGIYNVQEGRISTSIPDSYPNLRLWWDGDLQSELLDGLKFIKLNYLNLAETRILTASTYGAVNNWRNVPVLYGDILGDWREEVVYENYYRNKLLIFSTTVPTEERIYTLLHNPEYRLCLTTKGYYQSAQLDYFLGYDMSTPPLPPMQTASVVWGGLAGNNWNTTENNWLSDETQTTFNENDTVLFDIRGTGNTDIILDETVRPGLTYIISPVDYKITGQGELSGNGPLVKAGYGALELGITCSYTGETKIEQGTATILGEVTNSHVTLYGGAGLSGNGTLHNGLEVHPRGILSPGMETADTISIGNQLILRKNSITNFDLSSKGDSTNDRIEIDGDLTIEDGTAFNFNLLEHEMDTGDYILFTFIGEFNGSTENIKSSGLDGIYYEIRLEAGRIIVKKPWIREPGNLTWTGGENNTWGLRGELNWSENGSDAFFLPFDTVWFTESAITQNEIEIEGLNPIGQMYVNVSQDYIFNGSGSLTGDGGVIKSGSGVLSIHTKNSFTGPTKIQGGSVIIDKLLNGNVNSNLGTAGTNPEKLILNGGQLNILNGGSSDKGILIGTSGGSLKISGTQAILGALSGEGELEITGGGVLEIDGANNDFSGGTIISGSTVNLTSDDALASGLGTGPITLVNGHLVHENTPNSSNTTELQLVVPENSRSSYTVDGRVFCRDELSGSGTLDLHLTYFRSNFEGDWSGFNGTLNILAPGGSADFRVNNIFGYPGSEVILNNLVYAYHLTGDTVSIGSLQTYESAVIKNAAWLIGNNNKESMLSGTIEQGSITKTGTGSMTISGSNNTYEGGTVVREGSLWVVNAGGSATGTGAVFVENNGLLGGNGYVSGKVTVENGGYISPGYPIGTLHLQDSLVMKPGSILNLELNKTSETNDLLEVKTLLLDAPILFLNNASAEDYVRGDRFKILDTENIHGTFDAIYPIYPAKELYWDTTNLREFGLIEVTDQQPVKVHTELPGTFKVFPNPTTGILHIDWTAENGTVNLVELITMEGRVVSAFEPGSETKSTRLNMEGIAPGIMFLRITSGNRIYMEKIILNR